MNDNDRLRARCHNILPGHGKPATIAGQLRDRADSLTGEELGDAHGAGPYLENFEAEIASEFGKPAAVFMPSGSMAQQIALRLWCQQTGSNGIAMHPTAHLETAEHLGYQHLHGLHRLQFGAPESNHSSLLCLAELQALVERPGAILLEIPCRPLGGELPDWSELEAISAWARQSGIPIHLDGARIWSCRDAYQRSFAEIGSLFDSIYVSFYKDLGGLAGCMLLGPEDFVAQSRIWQRRHGGNLFSQAPYVAAARQGIANCLPQLPAWNQRAREIAAIINAVDGLKTRPAVPRVNFFQVYLEGEVTALQEAHGQVASDTGSFVFGGFRTTALPGVSMAEVHCWENAMAFDLNGLLPFLETMTTRADIGQ